MRFRVCRGVLLSQDDLRLETRRIGNGMRRKFRTKAMTAGGDRGAHLNGEPLKMGGWSLQ
jgi:hypothetical protein